MLCRYILHPPLANERLHLSEDGDLTLEFKRPWKDGTHSIALEPKALLARLSAIVSPPRGHVILYYHDARGLVLPVREPRKHQRLLLNPRSGNQTPEGSGP